MRSNVQIQTVLRQGKIKELLLSLRLITSYYHRRGQDHIMGINMSHWRYKSRQAKESKVVRVKRAKEKEKGTLVNKGYFRAVLKFLTFDVITVLHLFIYLFQIY